MQFKRTPANILTHNLLLLGLVIILFFLNFYTKTLFFPPTSTHQWRQADCLSITKNYYEEGMNFFSPKIHYQGPKDGKAVSEFPILNYTAAALWKIFGEHEYLYRLLEYFIYLMMIFVLYNTLARLYDSWLFALLICTILLTSPLLTYYSLNFIADVPALSLGIICFCLTRRFYDSGTMKYFYLALFTGTLAVLMKASALMGLSILLFFSVISFLNLEKFSGTIKLFKAKLFPAIFTLLALLIIIGWYRFALAYNLNNTNNVFLLTVLPIWEMQEADIIYNLKILFNNLFPVFLNKPMLFLFFTSALFVMVKFKQLDHFFRYAFVFSGLYFVFYLLFFYQVFGVHDYYLNNLMIFPVITFFSLGQILQRSGFMVQSLRFLRVFLIVSFVFNGFHAAAIYRLRMIEDDKMVYWFPFITREEKELSKYLFWDYGNSIKKLENFRPVLRAHGIRREEHVLSVPDQSFDISLYFLDQKGHTISREHFMLDSTVGRHFINKGIRYMILSDTFLKSQPAFRYLQPHLEPFFTENKVQVFRFKKSSQ